jgi:cytochrome c-type biogenesis protein CcmE
VIALSVAVVLAIFLLYTSIAGGGTPSVAPSELAGKKGFVTLVGHVQPGYRGDSYGNGLRFDLRDRKGSSQKTVTVLYKGSVSDQFRADREVSVKGELRNGVFVAKKDSLVTKCPSKYTAKPS